MTAANEGGRRQLTTAEWASLSEDEPGELVGGAIEAEEMPDAVHELTVSFLTWTLRHWLGVRGFVLGSELKVLVAPSTGRKPDISVFLPGSAAPPRHGVITAAPDIIVEVVSPSPRDERRDRVEKMAEYGAFGVKYYWLVDPALGSVEIFERSATGPYTRLVGVTAGTVNQVPGCPGLVLDVDALWAELARLAD
jgi:Uma2 family endonuclease